MNASGGHWARACNLNTFLQRAYDVLSSRVTSPGRCTRFIISVRPGAVKIRENRSGSDFSGASRARPGERTRLREGSPGDAKSEKPLTSQTITLYLKFLHGTLIVYGFPDPEFPGLNRSASGKTR